MSTCFPRLPFSGQFCEPLSTVLGRLLWSPMTPLSVAHGRDLGQAPRHPGLWLCCGRTRPGHGNHFTGCCLSFTRACMDMCGMTWEPFMNLFINGCLLMYFIFFGMTRDSCPGLLTPVILRIFERQAPFLAEPLLASSLRPLSCRHDHGIRLAVAFPGQGHSQPWLSDCRNSQRCWL